MKNIILIGLMIFSINLFAELTEEENSRKEAQAWSKGLNNYLINHDDADISMVGLHNQAMTFINLDENKSELDDLIQSLNDLVSQEKLHTQSLMMAANICDIEQLEDSCPIDKINAKLIQSEPKNLMAYLPALDSAILEKDQKEINRLINLMSKTSLSKAYISNRFKLDDSIDKFAKDHPIDGESFLLEIKQLNQQTTFSDELRKNIEERPYLYQQYMHKVNFKLLNPIPKYQLITNTCKSDQTYYLSCLKISDVMINHGHTIIDLVLGHHIQAEMYQLLDSHPQAEDAEKAKQKYKNEYKCVMKAFHSGEYSMDVSFNLEFYDKSSKLEHEKGEYEAYKTIAEMNYQRLLEKGDKQAIDPNTCFEKQADS